MNFLREEHIQFIWKYGLFTSHKMKTSEGETLEIIQLGSANSHQGPDFLNAAIRIDGTTLYGSIEIHIDERGWYEHKHHTDPRYNNVILHVVLFETHQIASNSNDAKIPTLNLTPYIVENTLRNLTQLMQSKSAIPCQSCYTLPTYIHIEQFKSRIFAERILRKSFWLKELILANQQNYEEAFYHALLAGFGMPVNKETFLNIARSIPQKLLAKYIHNLFQLEVLLLGQANLIPTAATDDYTQRLLNEYNYLKELHQLNILSTTPLRSKMLPPSFPTIRLAQFAAFVVKKQGLYSQLMTVDNIAGLKLIFDSSVSEYWQEHYDFGKSYSKKYSTNLSMGFIEKLWINIILPFRFLLAIQEEKTTEEILLIYQKINPENNSKIQPMLDVFSLKNQNAFDSQSLIEWNTEYCAKKKCLACPIGLATLRAN